MFIIKWWRFFRGYLLVSLSGRGLERLLNLAITRGIGFWDLHKQTGEARFCISLGSFKALRPLVRQSRCRLRILRKVGLPFWHYRLRRRWGLAVGAAIFFISLYLFSQIVWFVQVSGIRHLKREEVLALAEELGLRPGVWKRSLDLPELEEALARRHGDIAWVGMRLRGVLLEIEIVEHIPDPEPEHEPADLVAAKDGLVERVVVFEGTAVVEPGDTVVKGDLLIRGVLTAGDPSRYSEEDDLPALPVRARGVVEARVWYEALAPVVEQEERREDTGRTRKKYLLRWSEGELRLWGSPESSFDRSRWEVLKWSWRWRNLALPVELVIVTEYEQAMEMVSLSPGEALEKAREKALDRLKRQLPDDITAPQFHFYDFEEEGRRWVRAVAETLEDIVEPRPHR